ncbi:MAG: hypothetical protein Q4C95_11455 [Planctomycetia bacterium]|nr:hypothetical protein [Planctomycetia bacterium]
MRGGAIPIKHLYWAISGKRGVSESQSIGEYFTECSQTDKKPLFTECSEKTATTTKNVPQSVPPTSTIAVEEARNVFLPKEENDRGEKKMYKMFYFTSKYCVPCVTFEPILLRLKTEKFLIETISIETRDGEKLFRQAGLQGTPAFAFCSSNDSGKSWVIEEKWSGAPDGTEEKIRKLFNAKKQERSESSAESDWPTSPQVTKSDEPVFIETGDARPLLEEYESGWLSRTSPQEDDTSALRNKDGSTEGSALNQSETGGIINRVAALIARRAQEQIDELIQASGKQIDTLLNDLSETIKTEIKARIAKEVTHETQMFLAKNWLKILIAVVILFYVIGIILNAIAQKFPSTQKWLPRFGGESHESNAAPTESTVTTKTKARTN